MNQRLWLALLIGGVLLWWYYNHQEKRRPAPPPPAPPAPANPKPTPAPRKPHRPCPGPGPCPLEKSESETASSGWQISDFESQISPKGGGGRPVEGGRVSPDGAVELVCDLPASERKKNIASKGLGCCVFRSIDYAARWQQVPQLYDLPEQLVRAGIPGGGYPEKVDAVLARFGPEASYLQDTSGDADILEAILKTGRMPCVTYSGHDCHYAGDIAHMVCLPYFDRQSGWACVSDNNYPGENQFVWMSPDEFLKRWKGGSGGWVVCLLAPPPPLPPHN
jgi:hypothetical protein